jgi:hypothetical protein
MAMIGELEPLAALFGMPGLSRTPPSMEVRQWMDDSRSSSPVKVVRRSVYLFAVAVEGVIRVLD